ncbi:hypothetical protein [uncultured Eubacterium sp.]|nr:hypothetical protein [uncultured Eubacterium sp.]
MLKKKKKVSKAGIVSLYVGEGCPCSTINVSGVGCPSVNVSGVGCK